MALREHRTTTLLLLEILFARDSTGNRRLAAWDFCRDLGGCDLGRTSPQQLYFHS